MTDERLKDVRVLAFDVFGTVVDWCSSIAFEIEQLNPKIDGRSFARAWRAGYQPAMQRVRTGELPWTRIDDLHRMMLDDVLKEFGMSELDDSQKRQLNRAWHRLQAWPDSAQGIARLKTRYITTTLSNGNISLLVNMAKAADLNWDCILSAEVFQAYKPDPRTYLGVARVFDIRPDQVMLVAAHQDDLDAARECGLLTAYIERPSEFGTDMLKDVSPHPANTLHAPTITALADTLLS